MTFCLPRMMLVLLFCSAPIIALAQAPAAQQTTPTQQAPTSQQAPGATSAAPQLAQPDKPLLKPQELDQLVAPVALYPDLLLSNVLMASTYPLEVVQADRWLSQNQNLKADELQNAASQQPWDNSLKALIATPSVLNMMSIKLDWTQRLGDAVLAQQADVMDAVQRLRARAQANNKLTTTPQQRVTVRQEQNRQFIAIEPATPDQIYVPYYEPAVVYGAWPYPDYPPYDWGYPDYIAPGIIATGLAFGAAYGIARWAGYWRGGGFAWGNRGIIAGGGARVEHWRHNAAHRGGVGYTNANVRQQFGAANRAGNAARQNLQAGAANRAAASNRANAGNRAGAGNRAQARKGVSQRQAQARKSGARHHANRGGGRSAASRQARGGRNAGASRRARPSVRAGGAHGRGAFRGGGHGGGRSLARAGGGFRAGGFGGGGLRAGGFGGGRGGFGGGRGGGRRSDIALKRDVTLLGHLENGLGFYRFRYLDSDRLYVGVMAQEVQTVRPEAVTQGPDGYLRVRYDRIGLKFQTYDQWLSSGARVPATSH